MSHGNYKGYQGATRHTPSGHHQGAHILDSRLLSLSTLSPSLFTQKHILDIGCNNGNISVDLGLHFSPASVTGLDLDPSLIQSAKSHLSFKFSRLPLKDPGVATLPGESARKKSYFPVSSVLAHGHIPYPLQKPGDGDGEQLKFPFNVDFECVDVVAWIASQTGVPPPKPQLASDPDAMDIEPAFIQDEGTGEEEQGQYDVVLLLSVLKWIHLHHGDAILPYLFQQLHRLCRPDARLVLEAQEWESYEKAAKKNPRLWPKVNGLRVRSRDEVEKIMKDAGWRWEMGLEEEKDAKGKVRRRDVGVWRKV